MVDEVRAMVKLALPVGAMYVLGLSVQLFSQMLVGHVSSLHLAAAALALLWYHATGLALIIGSANACDTLCSQAFGARTYARVGRVAYRGCVISLLLGVVVAFGIEFLSEAFFKTMGQDPEVIVLAGSFLRVLLLSLPATCLFELLKKPLLSANFTGAPMLLSLLAVIISTTLGYVFVYHTPLGYLGAPLAIAISQWVAVTCMVAYLYHHRVIHRWMRVALARVGISSVAFFEDPVAAGKERERALLSSPAPAAAAPFSPAGGAAAAAAAGEDGGGGLLRSAADADAAAQAWGEEAVMSPHADDSAAGGGVLGGEGVVLNGIEIAALPGAVTDAAGEGLGVGAPTAPAAAALSCSTPVAAAALGAVSSESPAGRKVVSWGADANGEGGAEAAATALWGVADPPTPLSPGAGAAEAQAAPPLAPGDPASSSLPVITDPDDLLDALFPIFSLSDALTEWGAYLAMGMPAAAALMVEWGSYEALALIAGSLGRLELATHAVLAMTASLSFMPFLAVSVATCIRVGQALGDARPDAARLSVRVALLLTAVLFTLNAVIIAAVHSFWGLLFTDDEEVVLLVAKVIPLLALYAVFDGCQCVLSGALRGLAMQSFAAGANICSYLGVGLPLAYTLALVAHMRLPGMWVAFSCAVFTASAIMAAKLQRVNWGDKSVSARALALS